MRHPLRAAGRLLGVTALTLAMTGLAGGASAQDEEPSLCQLFDIDAFASVVGLEFEKPPTVDGPGACIYALTDAPEGLRDLHISLIDPRFGSYDQRREGSEAMGPVDLTIGNQRAFVWSDPIRGSVDDSVFVDLEHAVLSVSLTAEDGAVPDQREHVIGLAETVTGNLGPIEPEPTEPPEPPAIPVGASGVELPEVDGLTWLEQIGARGDQLAGMAENPEVQGLVGLFGALLDEVGSDLPSAGILVADARNGTSVGSLLVMRIDGVDQGTLERAVPVWLAAISSDFESVSATVGDKAVISVDSGGGDPTHVYISGDTVYLLAIGEEYEAPVLEALP